MCVLVGGVLSVGVAVGVSADLNTLDIIMEVSVRSSILPDIASKGRWVPPAGSRPSLLYLERRDEIMQ